MQTSLLRTMRKAALMLLVGIAFLSFLALPEKSAQAAIQPQSPVRAVTILPNHQQLVGSKIIQKSVVPLTVNPQGVPMDCLTLSGYAYNVSKGLTVSYDLYAYIKNTCPVSTANGGQWGADFQIECGGTLIDSGPLTGGIPAMSVGQQLTIIDGHYNSGCVDALGRYYVPNGIVVYLTAATYLSQDRGLASGGSEIEVL